MRKITFGIFVLALLFAVAPGLTTPAEADGEKYYPGYDVFDWGNPNSDKIEIASNIIATWKEYGEPVEAKFLDAKNLVEAIDAYDGDWNQALIFPIACEVAGVDIDSYENY